MFSSSKFSEGNGLFGSDGEDEDRKRDRTESNTSSRSSGSSKRKLPAGAVPLFVGGGGGGLFGGDEEEEGELEKSVKSTSSKKVDLCEVQYMKIHVHVHVYM